MLLPSGNPIEDHEEVLSCRQPQLGQSRIYHFMYRIYLRTDGVHLFSSVVVRALFYFVLSLPRY